MKLPNAHLATVPEQKITRYLLDPAHPAGGSKAIFFLRFGFSAANWSRLADALVAHAQQHDVVDSERTRYGTRYVVDGVLTAPDGTILNVRAAWYIDTGSDTPRFITARPLPRT